MLNHDLPAWRGWLRRRYSPAPPTWLRRPPDCATGIARSRSGYRAGIARSAVPPWRRVADDLRRRIESGEFSPGAPLPSLTSLAEQYQVSRTTARKAVNALRDDGLVKSVRGWETFVRRD